MNAIVVIVLVVLVADSYAKPLKRGSDTHWGYRYFTEHVLGPNLWWDQFEECAGLKQSPVYLKKSIAVDQCFEDIKLTGFGTTPPVGATMTLTNNGHTVKMSLSGDYLVDGGGLGATYRAGQFHFHWGKNNDRGSEHFMDFTPHPAEMHIVTYDTSRFGSIAEAVGEDGGLAVLGFLIELQEEDNKAFDAIVGSLKDIKEAGSSVQISPPINIESLLPASRSNFFRYDGSLTTPPCSEGVIWTNFKDTIHMSENQLKMFRDLRDESRHKIVDNFRPLEPLHGRTLYSNSC